MAEAVVRCGVCDSVATDYCKPCLLILCEGCAKGHSFYSGQHDIVPYWEINVPTFPTICSRHKKYLCTTYCKDCKIPVCKKCSSRKNEHKKHNLISIEDLSKIKEANESLEKRNSMRPNIEMKESSADDITSTEKQISESIKMSYVDKGDIFKVFEETETPLSGNEPENIKKTGSAYVNVDFEVQELHCFHGMLPREEAERLLIEDGDFLVRESYDSETNEPCCVLSANFQDHRHSILKCPDEQKHVSKDRHDSILAKVNQFYINGKPWEDCPDNILKHPIPREQWLIKNDDVVLEMELGKGYFGVVNKGIYKPMDISVAVKTCKEAFTQKQTKMLLKEGRSLVDYDHPNIVKFIGIAAIRPPVMIVMEYVAGKGICKLHV
nr:tyrosine-protein kinase Fer [Crassostrea gigas]